MKVHHIASGSSGNAILVTDRQSKLLLDAGISYSKLAAGLRQAGTRPSELDAVLITHEHGDHCKAVPELLRRGIPVMMSEGTAREIDNSLSMVSYTLCSDMIQREAGHWRILPFRVPHDAVEPMGFLFEHRKTGNKGVYIADSAYVAYDFPGVSHWIIECNYIEDMLEAGDYPDFVKQRIRRNHFSFENLKTFFRTSDLSDTKEIHLVHLSNGHTDEQVFVDELQTITGVPVYIPQSLPEASLPSG